MEHLPDLDDSARKRFRLLMIAVLVLAIALIAAIIFGSIRLAFAPVLARYYYSRGYSLTMKGDQDRAIAEFSKAIRLDPKFGDAHFAADMSATRRSNSIWQSPTTHRPSRSIPRTGRST